MLQSTSQCTVQHNLSNNSLLQFVRLITIVLQVFTKFCRFRCSEDVSRWRGSYFSSWLLGGLFYLRALSQFCISSQQSTVVELRRVKRWKESKDTSRPLQMDDEITANPSSCWTCGETWQSSSVTSKYPRIAVIRKSLQSLCGDIGHGIWSLHELSAVLL